jgi:hypothetical protein
VYTRDFTSSYFIVRPWVGERLLMEKFLLDLNKACAAILFVEERAAHAGCCGYLKNFR